jgi:hypothetical protein
MTDTLTVNPQILDAIHEVRSVVSIPVATWETGSAKAFNYVAQAAAMAVQDATDNLRNVSTLSTTAVGVAMTQLISSGDIETWGPVVRVAQGLVKTCAEDFHHIGETASRVLRHFPPGEPPLENVEQGD